MTTESKIPATRPTKCPQCGGANFTWAPRCDHCGHKFKSEAPTPEVFAIGRTPVAGEDAPDNPLRGPESDSGLRATLAAESIAQSAPDSAGTPAVMLVLVALNIIVFLLMVVSGVSPMDPTADALIRWGANYGPVVTHGQWWRLGTAMFLHIGVLHLLMNMYVLFASGGISERLFGRAGFAVLYLLCGLAASLTSLLWHPGSVGAGASGAIFGLYGGLFGFLIARRVDVSADARRALGKSGLTFVIGNLIIGAANPSIDLAAHLGGLLAGIPLGLGLALPRGTVFRHRISRAAIVSAIGLAVLAGLASQVRVNDDWRAALRRVGVLESSTNEAFEQAFDRVGKSMTPVEFANFVQEKLLPPWHVDRDTIASLRLPPDQRDSATKLTRYMTLRGDAWQLSSQAIKENSVDLHREASAKVEEAAAALYALVPSEASKAELQRIRTANAKAGADAKARTAAFGKLAEAEKQVLELFNDGLAGVRGGRVTPRGFSDRVNEVVIVLWDIKTRELMKNSAIARQPDVLTRLREYTALRRESFLLIAAGIEKNDIDLVKKGESRAAEALQVAGGVKR